MPAQSPCARVALVLLGLALGGLGWVDAARAQGGPPAGWSTRADGLFSYQGQTDLSDGGAFSVGRGFLRGSAIYRSDQGYSAGLSIGLGRYAYDFSNTGADPWDDVIDLRLTAPMRFDTGARSSVFLAPSLRYDYERDASASDGQTYGLFGGISWRINDRLTIGPAFGAFSEIGNDDWDVFPAVLVDWQIAERWRLSTAQAPGATQGPGLSLTYSPNDTFRYGLTARYERNRFALDDDGIAPGGVGQDSSLPVALSVQYAPNPATSLSAFVGAEFNGELVLEDQDGAKVSRQDYDTAPIAGISFRLAF
ncbi:MAG: hypothetical protein OIF47_08220 [Marinibacterium sp.]|nr:hypothetical protein [Marinibacterium sp.]